MATSDLHLQKLLKTIPHDPGVYQYYDTDGEILYVGKAKNLKKRVSSYFNKLRHDSGKTRLLVKRIADIKYIVVPSEQDALLLENSLIKKYQPRYNVLLKDDKTYVSICIKNERFPRIFSTRKIIRDGSQYFGPYTSAKVVHNLLDLAKKLYPLRTCSYNLSQENVDKGKFRVCLEYHIGNCMGPCENKQDEEEYNESIQAIKEIIRGNTGRVIKHLKVLMQEHAEKLQFEKAQLIKERISLLEKYQAKSTVVSPTVHNVDVFSIETDLNYGYVNFMRVANGAIIQSFTLELKKRLEETDEELLQIGIVELRSRFESHSKEVVVPFKPGIALKDVSFHVPQRGDKRKLLDLSQRNAHYFMLDKHKQEKAVDPERHTKRVLEQIKTDLRLSHQPTHIECFDNSNIQGTNPVSACVVFKNAKPSKKDYRHFNIKTVDGPDDFASMEEAVFRRYRRLMDESADLPQLIVIDGGKGQLSSAVTALERLGLRGSIAVVGIAKRLEEIYFPDDSVPLHIDKRSESLKVIQQLRNEAHRFSLAHHRNRRSKEALQSELLSVPGVGEKSLEKLMWEFKSMKGIKAADIEALSKVVGKSTATAIQKYFSEA